VVQDHSVRRRPRAKSEARKTVFSLTLHGIKLVVKMGIIIFLFGVFGGGSAGVEQAGIYE
jgi:hypothetical protein